MNLKVVTLLLVISVFTASASADTQRVILIWTGTNCPPCINLKNNIIPQADVQTAIKQYNGIHILNDPVAQLRQKWGIKAYPTIQIVDVKGNKPTVVHTQVGIGSKQHFLKILKDWRP